MQCNKFFSPTNYLSPHLCHYLQEMHTIILNQTTLLYDKVNTLWVDCEYIITASVNSCIISSGSTELPLAENAAMNDLVLL